MRLINLHLTNYRRFNEVMLDFPDGVIGIIGDNGAGKSSLMEAISWTLYGSTRSGNEDVISSSNGSDYCQSILTLEIDSKEYEVVRLIKGKNFISQMSVFTIENGAKTIAAKGIKASEDFLIQKIGMDRFSFETSFFAKQHQLNALSNLQPSSRKQRIIKMLKIDVIDKAKELVKQDLAEDKAKAEGLSLSLADPNTVKVKIIEIDKNLNELLNEISTFESNFKKAQLEANNAKNNHEDYLRLKDKYINFRIQYKELAQEKKSLVDNLNSLQTQINEIKETKALYQKITPHLSKLKQLESDLAQQEILKEKFQQYAIKKSKSDSLNQELGKATEKLKTLKTSEKKLNLIADHLKELDFIDEQQKILKQKTTEKACHEQDVKHYLNTIKEIDDKLNNLDDLKGSDRCPTCLGPIKGRLPQIEKHFEQEKEGLQNQKDKSLIKIKSLTKEIESKEKDINKRADKKKQLEREKFHYQKEIERLDSINKEIAALMKDIKELGLQGQEAPEYNAQVHKGLLKELNKYRDYKDKALVMETKLAVESETKKEFESKNARLKNIDKKFLEIKEKAQALNFDKKKEAQLKEDYESRLNAFQESKIKLTEINFNKQNKLKEKELLQKELENITKQQMMLKDIKKRNKELRSLANLFDDFKKELIGRIRPALSQKSSTLINQITDGRYNRLELTSDYDIMLFDGNKKYIIDRFSGGEKDLANLCLRLSISELMAESSRSDFNFIILDEVFGSQDNVRKGNIISALQALSKRFRQLFVITHVEEIKGLVDTVIEVKEKDENLSYLRVI